MAKNLEKEFVTYEQAVALKELGFDEPCLARFNPDNEIIISHTETYKDEHRKSLFTQAPLKQQVFRWFREKYDAHMHPTLVIPNVYMVQYALWTSKAFDNYEEAENACIDKLIELAKQDKNERTI